MLRKTLSIFMGLFAPFTIGFLVNQVFSGSVLLPVGDDHFLNAAVITILLGAAIGALADIDHASRDDPTDHGWFGFSVVTLALGLIGNEIIVLLIMFFSRQSRLFLLFVPIANFAIVCVGAGATYQKMRMRLAWSKRNHPA